jgi:hypothetical protein
LIFLLSAKCKLYRSFVIIFFCIRVINLSETFFVVLKRVWEECLLIKAVIPLDKKIRYKTDFLQTHQNATTTNMSCCFIASKHQTTNEFLHENEQNLINLKLFGNFNINVIIILREYFWFQSALYCMSILMTVLL